MKENISKKQLRVFGIFLGFVFPIIFGWILPAIGGHFFRIWTLCIGIPSLIIGITKPRLLLLPYKGWRKLGNVLGWLNSRIILGIIFFLILQPTSLIMISLGYDPLKKRKGKEKSYRELKEDHKVDLTRIF